MQASGVDPSLLPQPPGGTAPGAALAVAVHVGLVAALALGVSWRMNTPEAVSAELWAALPQVAAPRVEEPPAPVPAPQPPPPPPKAETPPQVNEAQIAIERERKAREEREKERERAEAEKKKREAEQKKREAEDKRKQAEAEKREQARLDQLREEQIRRLQGALQGSGAPTSTGTAAQDAAPSATYAGKLRAHIKPHIVFAETLPGNPAAEVEVRAAPGGTIISRRLTRSSGFKEWDEAVLRAIDRAGTLPRDVDGRVPSTLIITFRPND